jgi:protein SCO1/2
MRLALVEASENRLGGVADQVLLYCFSYNPLAGKYTAVTMNILRLAALVTVATLGSFIVLMLRRDRRRGTTTEAHA